LQVVSHGCVKSDTIRVCGPGGGSRYEGLALDLRRALFSSKEGRTE